MWKTEYKQRRADNSPWKNAATRRPRYLHLYVRAFFSKTRDSRLSYSSPVVASWHISTLCPPPKTSTYIICGQQTSLHESEYGVPTASGAISRTAVSRSQHANTTTGIQKGENTSLRRGARATHLRARSRVSVLCVCSYVKNHR